jgi:peroxiredoxin
MGIRCKRYAMLIEDGVFVKEYADPFIEGVL